MMKIKNIIICMSVVILTYSCMKEMRKSDFNDDSISGVISLQVKMAEGHDFPLEGITVKFTDSQTGLAYSATTDKNGLATARVSYGTYIASAESKTKGSGGVYNILNGTTDRIRITPSDGSATTTLQLKFSQAGQIVIKEIYYGGCKNEKTGKVYSKDQYFTLYNNSDEIAYLDSLCVGVVYNYNAPTNGKLSDFVKPGTSELRDSVPVANIGWMFKGKGKDIPLQPGHEIVVALNAINHTKAVANSVNLGVPGYFALYNPLFTKTQSVPEAGVITLDGFWKAGSSTAYVFSLISPGVFIYSLGGKSINNFIKSCYSVNPTQPSNRNLDVLLVDKNFVMDAVECFRSATDSKRFRPENDNGYVMTPGSGQGYSVLRKVDQEATKTAGGRVVYMDTNNSTNDFEVINNALLTGK